MFRTEQALSDLYEETTTPVGEWKSISRTLSRCPRKLLRNTSACFGIMSLTGWCLAGNHKIWNWHVNKLIPGKTIRKQCIK